MASKRKNIPAATQAYILQQSLNEHARTEQLKAGFTAIVQAYYQEYTDAGELDSETEQALTHLWNMLLPGEDWEEFITPLASTDRHAAVPPVGPNVTVGDYSCTTGSEGGIPQRAAIDYICHEIGAHVIPWHTPYMGQYGLRVTGTVAQHKQVEEYLFA